MRAFLFTCSMLIVSITPAHSSFLRSIIEDIQALNEFNRINREELYKSFKHTLDDIDNPFALSATKKDIDATITTFADLAGYIPEDIHEMVTYIHRADDYTRVGAQMPHGILLYGPGGTGKTSIARAIAGESNAAFFATTGSEFVEMYVGVGPQRIRELFNKARTSLSNGYDRAIIFIDEIDAIGGKRDAEPSSEYRNTLNELLNQLDGFNTDNHIFVIGATNEPHMLDKALLRPGRFDRLIEIPLPDYEGRRSILQHYMHRIAYDDADITAELAQKTTCFNNAELKSLVNEAAICAAREKCQSVTADHMREAYRKMLTQKKLR